MAGINSFMISLGLSITAIVMFIMGIFGVYRAPLLPMAFVVLFIASIFMNIALLS